MWRAWRGASGGRTAGEWPREKICVCSSIPYSRGTTPAEQRVMIALMIGGAWSARYLRSESCGS